MHEEAGPAGGIGVIVPFDFALDRELWRWVPEPVALHLTRTSFVPSPVTAEMARAISDPEPVRAATRDVLEPGPGIVAALGATGATRVAIVTPYVDSLTDLLAGSVRSAVGPEAGAVLGTEADPHDLGDAPTRALDLAAQAVSTGDPGSAPAVLLHADSVEHVVAEPDDDEHVLAVPAPGKGWLVARRSWAPFTVTESARAAAFVRALTARTPVAP